MYLKTVLLLAFFIFAIAGLVHAPTALWSAGAAVLCLIGLLFIGRKK